jgi:uncharacterized protein (DUF488 family)
MTRVLRVYSLGYQGVSLDRYVEVLKSRGITMVVDVRETPWSYKRGFSRKPLTERLNMEGISYVHVKSAGNPSRNRKMGLPQEEVIALYKKHLADNPSCLSEIHTLIAGASKSGGACLLCFEEKPQDCHRKVILDKLAEQSTGLTVYHLDGRDLESKEPIGSTRVPEPDNGKRSRIHMKVPQKERGSVSL